MPNSRTFPFPSPRGGGTATVKSIPKDLEEMLKRFFGPEVPPREAAVRRPRRAAIGSGFVYDDKGHILTNNHVVEDADKITVTFHDGVEAPATVVGTDPKSDVAVIKVETLELSAAAEGRQHQAEGRRAGDGGRLSVRAEPDASRPGSSRPPSGTTSGSTSSSRSSRPTRRSTRATRAGRWST